MGCRTPDQCWPLSPSDRALHDLCPPTSRGVAAVGSTQILRTLSKQITMQETEPETQVLFPPAASDCAVGVPGRAGGSGRWGRSWRGLDPEERPPKQQEHHNTGAKTLEATEVTREEGRENNTCHDKRLGCDQSCEWATERQTSAGP